MTTDMPTLLKAAIEQNFVPVVDDRNVFIGMVRRTVLLRELYDKYTTLPTDKRFKVATRRCKGLQSAARCGIISTTDREVTQGLLCFIF